MTWTRFSARTGPGRLGDSLAQPQLNHAEQYRGYAALPLDEAHYRSDLARRGILSIL